MSWVNGKPRKRSASEESVATSQSRRSLGNHRQFRRLKSQRPARRPEIFIVQFCQREQLSADEIHSLMDFIQHLGERRLQTLGDAQLVCQTWRRHFLSRKGAHA
jgi:hypothetical protein